MADVFERTVGLTADEVARLEELDRLNPNGKDRVLWQEQLALVAKAQRAAQARLGVAGGGPCEHCGTPLEANGTCEVDGRSTHTEAVCLHRVVAQRQRCLGALHGIAGALDARRFLADAEAGTRKLTAPLVASMRAKALTDGQIRDAALDAWEGVALALLGELPAAGVVVVPAGKVHRLWGIWYKHKGAPAELKLLEKAIAEWAKIIDCGVGS